MALLTDMRSCLKAIEEGNVENINVPIFIKKFLDDPSRMGDHLQFALHKCCKNNEDEGVNETVIKLSLLCFSKESAIGFNNMDRFLGSLFHICSYFIKKNLLGTALEICKSIKYKKTEIELAAMENQTTRNFLYILHSHFITAAQNKASEVNDVNSNEMQVSYEMAQTSLNFLKLIKSKQFELGRKLFRNFRSYLTSVKFFDKKQMYEMYMDMEKILNNLMPMYKDNDFLLYFILKMNQVEGISSMELKDLNNYFKKHLEIITVLLNDSQSMRNWALIFSIDPTRERYFRNLVDSVAKITLNENHKFYYLIFSMFLNLVGQFWIKNFIIDWTKYISTKIMKRFYYNIILPMRNGLQNLSEYCRLVEYQMGICFSDFYIMNLLLTIHMIRYCLKYKVNNCLDLINISREAFKNVVQYLNDMKNVCCSLRKKTCWSSLIVHYTNTIEGILSYANSKSSMECIRDCSEDLLNQIVNAEFELPFEWKRVRLIFQRWHYSCIKLKEYNRALFVCAFYAVTYPQEEDEAVSMWIQTKQEVTPEIGERLTFKDVIENEEDKIRIMNPKYDPLKVDLARLLMKELKGYSSAIGFKSSATMIKSVIHVRNLLKIMNLELTETAAALYYVIFTTVYSADSETLKKYKKDCESIINEIINVQVRTVPDISLLRTLFLITFQDSLKSDEKRRDCKSILYAGNLKYSLFLCYLKRVQDKEDKVNSSKSILEYLKKEEKEKVKFGEMVDMNLTCNVMPSTNHFTVTFEEFYLTALNETLHLWEEAAQIVDESSLDPDEFGSWLNNVKQISQMFYLIGDVYQSLMSWLLYYRIAKICGNRTCTLLGLSQIIRECASVEDSKILKEAEEIADDLMANDKEKDILIVYWLALASNYLKNKNEERCFYYLCNIKKLLGSVKSSTRAFVYKARFLCLVSKFLCLYDGYMEDFGFKPQTELRTVVYKAFGYAISAAKDESTNVLGPSEYNEVLLTMLEVNVWAFQFFGVYHLAAFMRLSLDSLYQIFQKLVLPTRTAYVLALLAEVDIMCEKNGEAETKLNSLKSILGTSSLPNSEDGDAKPRKSGLLDVPRNGEGEGGSPRGPSPARFLSVHDGSRERDPSPFRYVLNDVDLVKRLSHTQICTCYVCRNIIIKLLYVKALLLEAQLSNLEGCMKKSCTYFKEGYKNGKKLESYQLELSEKLFGEVSKSVPDLDSNMDFQSDIIKSNSVKFLTDYAIFMLSPGLKEDMIEDSYKLIVKIDNIMMSLSYETKLMQWRVMELKLMLFTIRELRRKKVEEEEEEEEDKDEVGVIHAKTSSSPTIAKTPQVSKNPKNNAAPVKYKKCKNVHSPNLFVSRPSGRKIFGDDEENPGAVAENEAAGKKQGINGVKSAAAKEECFKRPKRVLRKGKEPMTDSN